MKSGKLFILISALIGITSVIITISYAKSRLIDEPVRKKTEIPKHNLYERCSSISDCKRGSDRSVCDMTTKRCVQCLSKNNCPRDKYCDTSQKICVDCVMNSHCNDGINKICGPEKKCVECTKNYHCNNPKYPNCTNNKCTQ